MLKPLTDMQIDLLMRSFHRQQNARRQVARG